MKPLVDRFIAWVEKRDTHPLNVVTHEEKRKIITRYQPFWDDEWAGPNGESYARPPWWRPFNILVHRWEASHRDQMHDHPRWSITICLRGSMIERTPWGSRVLTPGSIVIRSRKAIHAFEMLPGETPWTVFIVGRRNHKQNGYVVTPFGKVAA